MVLVVLLVTRAVMATVSPAETLAAETVAEVVKPPWVNVAALAGPFGRTEGVSAASKIMPAAIRTTVCQDVAATNRDRRPTLYHTHGPVLAAVSTRLRRPSAAQGA